MRAVVQRVTAASVTVEEQVVGRIGPGLVVFAAVGEGDSAADRQWIAGKVVNLRIFHDAEGRFDRTVQDGRRPSFTQAAAPEVAREQFAQFVECLRATGVPVETGTFQAAMRVDVANDGPVTILLDSGKAF